MLSKKKINGKEIIKDFREKGCSAETKNGQSLIEYSIILGIIAAVVLAVSPMLKRGIQSMVKLVADEIGNQQLADQVVSAQTGHLDNSYSLVRVTSKKEIISSNGVFNYVYPPGGALVNVLTSMGTNAGYTEQMPP